VGGGEGRMKERFPYEQHTRWSQDTEQARKWTEALEAIGTENLRVILAKHPLGSTHPKVHVGAADISKEFAQLWLKWHDDRKAAAQDKLQKRMLLTAIFAAFAAISSAVGTGIQAYYAVHPPQHTTPTSGP
jgi:hypothetical protein